MWVHGPLGSSLRGFRAAFSSLMDPARVGMLGRLRRCFRGGAVFGAA